MSEAVAKLRAFALAEEAVLEALTRAHKAGQLAYAHYSPAWDVTATRVAALSYAILQAEGQAGIRSDGTAA